MFLFIESFLHLLYAVLAIIIGIFICFYQNKYFKIPVGLSVSLFSYHTLFCILYYAYSLSNNADSSIYYSRSIVFLGEIKFGTQGVTFLTSILSSIGMSYGNVFLIYNIIGFIGLIGFTSVIYQLSYNSSKNIRWLTLSLAFLPGVSFWSSAIGKDAITFMGSGLVCWSVMNPSKRYISIFIAFLSFLIARPHMAGILLASITLSIIIFSNSSLIKKFILLSVLSPLAVIGVGFGLEYAGLGEAQSAGDVTEYFEERQGANMSGGSSVDIANMSIPLRLFTYLFRPIFFDASGFLGVIVSLENAAILTLFAYFLINRMHTGYLNKFAKSFYLLFSVVSLFILANTTANLGIAIRQKWMFLPMLIIVFVSSINSLSHKYRPKKTSYF